MLLLTAVGWLLWPRFPEADEASGLRRVEGVLVSSEAGSSAALLNLPTLFAFRSPIGFVSDDYIYGQVFFKEAPHLISPTPEAPQVDFAPMPPAVRRWPGEKTIWGGGFPPAPVLAPSAGGAAADTAKGGREVKVIVSDEGVRMMPLNGLKLKGMAGMSFRAQVVFGADGWSEAAVLGPNALAPAEAAAVERALMRMTGPAGSSCWVTFMVPE